MIAVLLSLWLPILLSAVLVFMVSSIIHMLLGYHAADWKKMPPEDEVVEPMRRFQILPGDYVLPCPDSPAHGRSPGFAAKMAKRPIVGMTVWPAGPPRMGASLVPWFIYPNRSA